MSKRFEASCATVAGARSPVDIEDPGLRGSALWFARSVMASFRQHAADRQTAYRRTARICPRCAPKNREFPPL
jgi:hypothetical protein